MADNIPLSAFPKPSAEFLEWKRQRSEREARLIASDQLKPGDVPEPLTEGEEQILDEAWAELRAKEGIVVKPVDGVSE